MGVFSEFSCKNNKFSLFIMKKPTMERGYPMNAGKKKITALMAGTALAAFMGAAQAGDDGLTTYEEYAAMTPKEQNVVRGNAMGAVYGQAAREGDISRKQCLITNYLKGPEEQVAMAHARLRGAVEAGVEVHDSEDRVEYLVENVINGECPRTPKDQLASLTPVK